MAPDMPRAGPREENRPSTLAPRPSAETKKEVRLMVQTLADTEADLHPLCIAAAELIDEIGDLAERDRASMAAGYRLAARTFFQHGVEVGREQVLAAIIDGQDDTRRRLAGLAREPAWTELERIRREPGNLWRFGEGKTKDPDFYTINLLRHGGVEYAGGPVPLW